MKITTKIAATPLPPPPLSPALNYCNFQKNLRLKMADIGLNSSAAAKGNLNAGLVTFISRL